eukprot:6195677-Pleurochrysis_carterae.AAC.6
MDTTKVTDILRTGLSTAERTGPVLAADRPFLHRVGNERGNERKILNTIQRIRTCSWLKTAPTRFLCDREQIRCGALNSFAVAIPVLAIFHYIATVIVKCDLA